MPAPSFPFLAIAMLANHVDHMMCASPATMRGRAEQAHSYRPQRGFLVDAHACADSCVAALGVMPNKLAKQTLSTNAADHSFKLYKELGRAGTLGARSSASNYRSVLQGSTITIVQRQAV